jgi:hypothetical protein
MVNKYKGRGIFIPNKNKTNPKNQPAEKSKSNQTNPKNLQKPKPINK